MLNHQTQPLENKVSLEAYMVKPEVRSSFHEKYIYMKSVPVMERYSFFFISQLSRSSLSRSRPVSQREHILGDPGQMIDMICVGGRLHGDQAPEIAPSEIARSKTPETTRDGAREPTPCLSPSHTA